MGHATGLATVVADGVDGLGVNKKPTNIPKTKNLLVFLLKILSPTPKFLLLKNKKNLLGGNIFDIISLNIKEYYELF